MSECEKALDTLFLLDVNFQDPAYPDTTFYCWHCMLIEGLLAKYPTLQDRLQIIRVAWSKPRQVVVDLLGPENQSLPALILAPGEDPSFDPECKTHGAHQFINDLDGILKALAMRHGIARPHP